MVTALVWFGAFITIVWLLFLMFGDTFCGKALEAFLRIVFELLILATLVCIIKLRGDYLSWLTIIASGMYVIDIIINIFVLTKIKFKNKE